MFIRALIAPLLLLVAGCAGHSSVADGTSTAVQSVTTLPVPQFNDRTALTDADYLVGPLDTLDVSVFQVADLTRTVQADASGRIAMPLIGAIEVRGRTTREISSEIGNRLKKYVQNPDVTVTVREAMSQRVTVEGAVNAPGVYPVMSRMTLLQMIATAKGLEANADQRLVVVFRRINGQKMAAAFDVHRIRDGQAPDPDVYGNDIVVVERNNSKSALRSALSVVPLAALFRPFLF